MLEHPDFRPKVRKSASSIFQSVAHKSQLFIAGNVANAGQEEMFPGPDNHSKMRRSVENAEHVGLFIPFRYDAEYWYPMPNPGALEFRRHRPLRRGGRLDFQETRRRGFYLPPARACPNSPEPEDFPKDSSPTRRRIPVLVDTRSPYDPFAGRAS